MDTLWFEVAVMSTAYALGHILFGHFAEKTPRWRQVVKLFMTIGLGLLVSATLGRVVFFALCGLILVALLYVHAWVLPRRYGINGWTAEPKEKYYALRGWSLEK